MLDSYNSAFAPGTIKNRRTQVQLYLKFMLIYNFNYLCPTPTEMGMYYQFLSNSFAAPGTAKNHLSGVKSWLQLHQGSIGSFSSPELAMIIKSVSEKSGHIPSPASPISEADIRTICRYIHRHPQHPGIKAAILLAFSTFMRVSNVLSPSTNSYGGKHTLRVNDISPTREGLKIFIRSTKTKKTGAPHVIQVFRSSDSLVCPVSAWEEYLRIIQPCPVGPAFMLDISTPLTSPPVVKVMRDALHLEHQNRAVSFHSLRRGGAQAAARNGASDQGIMHHGTWASKSGLRHYINSSHRIIPTILAATLAKS